jgi:hypothetical protein
MSFLKFIRCSGVRHSLADRHDHSDPNSAPVILAALASLLAGAAASPPSSTMSVTSTVYAQTTIIRVPARRSSRYHGATSAPPPPAPPRFKERRGPKCIDAAAIGGAAISTPDSVDFILKGGKRVRAYLENECPALDYYSGFYVRPPQDGRICADRDSVHTRSGGDCQVDRFRLLTPIP